MTAKLAPWQPSLDPVRKQDCEEEFQLCLCYISFDTLDNMQSSFTFPETTLAQKVLIT